MNRIKEMSKLQPLRQGEAVVTKQQIIDAVNNTHEDYEKIVIAVVVVFAFALAICFVLKCLRKTFCSSSKKVTKK